MEDNVYNVNKVSRKPVGVIKRSGESLRHEEGEGVSVQLPPTVGEGTSVQLAFDGSGYSHTAARMECFSRLLEVVRVLKVQLFGAGEGKSVTHPRKVTIMASLTQFVIGQVSKGFAGLDLKLMYKEATGYFHSRYTDALSKDRGLEEQADLLRESMLYLGYQLVQWACTGMISSCSCLL